MTKKMPVVAAIPVYETGEQLHSLLTQTLQQEYDHVYVADDASKDPVTLDVLHAFSHDATVIYGRENIGAGGNRNRAAEALAGRSAMIHFIDADMSLLSQRNVDLLREYSDPHIGFIGGLVLDQAGKQHIWNYGPRQCLHTSITGALQQVRTKVPAFIKPVLRDWPNPDEPPKKRVIFWPVESNFAVHSHAFAKIGGFDSTVREHDIQGPAIRAHQLGFTSYFEPAVSAQHTGIDVRDYNRQLRMLRDEAYWAKHYGLRNWLAPEGQFRPKL